jgi:prepilin-type N-terminal cleavage/methylation domain-containing protein
VSKKEKKNNRRTGSRGQQGFSLIEVMIAIVILTVGLLSLAQMMVVATNANALAGRMTASAALAKQQLELLKAAPFYTNPATPSPGAINPVLESGGSLTADATNGAGVDCFQYYDADGLQPPRPACIWAWVKPPS